jgi:hypothetical protein
MKAALDIHNSCVVCTVALDAALERFEQTPVAAVRKQKQQQQQQHLQHLGASCVLETMSATVTTPSLPRLLADRDQRSSRSETLPPV